MAALRVILALINKVHEEEALLDSGSQIISMSCEAASTCKITWDPELTINMQSANGQITKTCGLAKNIPFNFGNITIHLQVHVMEQAPYRVLLGRPFDVITESQIANSTERQQFISITDPNSGEHASLSTYFDWGPEQIAAQTQLKKLIEECFHTQNPQFPCDQPIVLAVDTSWRAVGYYMYQQDETEPKKIHYIKFNSLLIDEKQQCYTQPKHELCGLRMALEEETYLLNLVVETDAKYLSEMLNNPGKMPNATINCWVDYIRISFQFTLIHKKGKMFGPNGLSRRKWYSGDPIERRFNDRSEDDGEDLEVIKENPDDKDPLPLETFIDEIDN
ncbi:hypothetical protein AN958_01587 [Leucoagaricus sp. SymC.cos]|nr:hypothetical protein AN958_01587 [Leucoagaricus sp. SymC.cos]